MYGSEILMMRVIRITAMVPVDFFPESRLYYGVYDCQESSTFLVWSLDRMEAAARRLRAGLVAGMLSWRRWDGTPGTYARQCTSFDRAGAYPFMPSTHFSNFCRKTSGFLVLIPAMCTSLRPPPLSRTTTQRRWGTR